MKSLAIILLAIATNVGAYPPEMRADTSVTWVYNACTSKDDKSKMAEGYCSGFIAAISNTVSPWCVPGNLTRGELERSVVDGLKRFIDKQAGSESASEAIEAIIKSNWPCG